MNARLAIFGILAISLLFFGCVGKEPSNVTATPVAGGIQITWGAVSDIAGYNVYRSTESGTAGGKINSGLITGETSYTDTSVSNGATYYYTVKSVDSGGNEYGVKQASATARTAPPQNLQIAINHGAQYASQQGVTLTLFATGATQCRLSNDGNSWSDWESYITSKAWQLTSGDGQKDVYYQCKDGLGNTAQPASAAIYLDTTPPTITITSPVSGSQYGGAFDLIFTVADPISTTVTCSGQLDGGNAIEIGVIDAGVQHKITVNANAGSRALTVSCTDGVQNATQNVRFTIVDKPSVSLVLGDGSGYTSTQNVNVYVTATLASECRLSNDGVAWGNWAPYVSKFQWQLSSGDGTKYIYAQCRGTTGVTSDAVYDTIILDTHPPPYISITINNEAKWTNSRDVYLGLYSFAASQCRFSNDEITWSDWEPYSTRRAWTLSQGEGTKYVYYECKKTNGDTEGPASASIIFSTIPPDPPTDLSMTINDGSAHTTSKRVHLRLYAENANECRYQQDDYGWTSWEDYTTSRYLTLEGGDGSKIIYYQCRNDYGQRSTHDTIYLDTGPPGPVYDLSARVTGYYSVYLRWSRPSGDVSGFSIYRSTRSLGLFGLIGSTTSTTYTDVNVMPGEGYSYYVIVRSSSGQQSTQSNLVSVEIPGPYTDESEPAG